ncbi:hypothetical protein QC761_512034 [Podospora bellae-mahoneyi]|uniref:Uncharacterized protein n=1 Tax=Podospora bellae-mahoneyi TaxID=2093777 RepID=A0ABR0FG82_9PEZI|nr:hypothetical protein QC761_512034 [Podospora bellae-mahoneyi]
MPPRKQIGVPSTAPTRRSSHVASREATTTPEPAHPPSLKATKASASATPKPPKSSTVRYRPRRRSPRTQAAIEEELAGEVQDAAAGQDASEERKASAVDSFDWNTLTRENQFCYGNEEEHISVGTGFHLLGTNKHIPSQYPSPYNMRFEVQSGNSKIKKSGGVRIIGGADGIKMIPFVNIKHVIILPEPKAKRQKSHRVLNVPTAATGLSPIKRKYPKIISFSLPNKKADKDLIGTIGEAADASKDTYLSVFRKVFNQKLKPFGKSVIGATHFQKAGIWEGKTTVRFQLNYQPHQRAVRDIPTIPTIGGTYRATSELGVRFEATATSFARGYKSLLLLAYENGEPAGVRYLIENLSEPYFAATADAKKDEQNSLMIGFDGLPVELLDELKKWSERNKIKTTRMNLGGLSTTMPETHQRQASSRRCKKNAICVNVYQKDDHPDARSCRLNTGEMQLHLCMSDADFAAAPLEFQQSTVKNFGRGVRQAKRDAKHKVTKDDLRKGCPGFQAALARKP